jgi:thiazole synthase ThiGH ThiG subunit
LQFLIVCQHDDGFPVLIYAVLDDAMYVNALINGSTNAVMALGSSAITSLNNGLYGRLIGQGQSEAL